VTTADKLLALANLSAARAEMRREMDQRLAQTREPDAPSMLDSLRYQLPSAPSASRS
jgi:hypothetical protein